MLDSVLQSEILKVSGVLCLFLCIFVLIVKFQSYRKKIALLGIEIAVAILLLADYFTIVLDGTVGTLPFVAIRLSYLLLYLCYAFAFYSLNNYLITTIMEKGKLPNLPKRLLVCFILCGLFVLVTIISQFTGILYSFDSMNSYYRGDFYVVPYILTTLIIIIQVSSIIQFRKIISKRIYIALLIFMCISLVGGGIQLFNDDVSYISFSMFISAVSLYLFSLVEHNEFLLKVANTEIMTGLPNSYGYREEVEKIIRSNEIGNYNAYYFDIVRMAQYNKRYGNDTGDQIIKSYAEYIRSYIRKDEVVGRLGGNYFVALIRKENTEPFLELLQGVPIDVELEEGVERIYVAAIAGVYELTEHNTTSEPIIGYTSMAISYAKNVAKEPYVVLTSELIQKIQDTRQLEESIPNAIANGEFIPYYQPKVNIGFGTISGAEAIVRWEHDGKFLSPATFIPFMEKNGTICKLDFYMFERVCGDIEEWLSKGLEPPRVSINFSRRHLGNPNLVSDIYEIVKKHNIPTKYVEIEITETFDEYPLATLKKVVDGLQKLGIAVALDDFGTGSSSMLVLKEIEFDVLKIDKSFIDYKSDADVKLLGHIITIARERHAAIIAEGVETEEQLETLLRLGCESVQGYMFDMPLTKDQFEYRFVNK